MSISLPRRAWPAAGAVAVVVLAVVLVVALTSGPDARPSAPRSTVRPAAPAYVADPVPKAKRLTKDDVPKQCGIRAATLHTYEPDAERDLGFDSGPGACGWYSDDDRGATYHERILNVLIDLSKPAPEPSADGEALSDLDPAADQDLVTAGHPPRPVGGLGDEALYSYAAGLANGLAHSDGATLLVRVGATVATITYRGREIPGHGPAREVPEKQARAAVLAAGADVARALHAPAHPVLGSAAATVPPPEPRRVRPCDLVPAALADRLAAGATRERPDNTLWNGKYGQVGDSCEWNAESAAGHRPERHLSVTVYAESEWRPGMAVAQATRKYLELHDDARAADAAGFGAVRGLGDQAYAVYRDKPEDEGGGEVTFRYRNMVVSVGYSGGSEDPLGEGPAINGAYTVATRVLQELR